MWYSLHLSSRFWMTQPLYCKSWMTPYPLIFSDPRWPQPFHFPGSGWPHLYMAKPGWPPTPPFSRSWMPSYPFIFQVLDHFTFIWQILDDPLPLNFWDPGWPPTPSFSRFWMTPPLHGKSWMTPNPSFFQFQDTPYPTPSFSRFCMTLQLYGKSWMTQTPTFFHILDASLPVLFPYLDDSSFKWNILDDPNHIMFSDLRWPSTPSFSDSGWHHLCTANPGRLLSPSFSRSWMTPYSLFSRT